MSDSPGFHDGRCLVIGPLDPVPAVAHAVATTAEQRQRQELNATVNAALAELPEQWDRVVAAYAESVQAGRAALARLAVELMDVEAAELAARSA